MKPNSLKDTTKNLNSKEIYNQLYSKINDKSEYLYKIMVPFKLMKIHFCSVPKEINYLADDENKETEAKISNKIVKIFLSQNQKKIYTLNKKNEIYLWYQT